MIQIMKKYAVICDRCGEMHVDFENGSSEFDDEDSARESAADDGWVEIGKRHFCPDCYDFNNNISDNDTDIQDT